MRDVAVVSFAQTPYVRRERRRNEVEMLMPVIAGGRQGARASSGRRSASRARAARDYLAGQSFSFVMARRRASARGRRSASRHVEMDGAWALYEAWVKIQTGEVDSALVYGFGKSSLGDLPEMLTLQIDPYTWRRSGRTRSASPRCRPAPCSTRPAGPSATWPRSPCAAGATRRSNPTRSVKGDFDVDELLAEPLPRVARCASTTARRSPTARRAIVLAAGDRRAQACASGRPGSAASTTASSRTSSASRDLDACRRRPSSRAQGGRSRRHDRRRRAARAVQPPGADPARARSGLGDDVRVNPSGGALAANPMMAAGLARIGEARRADPRGRRRDRAVAHATSGPCLQQNLVCVLEGDVMAERAAVIGIGQTKHDAKRTTSRWPAWCARRPMRALDDAGLDWTDIDAVVIGKAPDLFEGVMMPELFLADALGASGKPHAARAHRRLRRRLDGDRRGQPRAGRRPRARAHGRLREAVRVERHVGALDAHAVRSQAMVAGAGGYFAPLDPRLHPALRRARAHGHPRRGEGPPERAQEPLRAPASCRTSPSRWSRTRRCCGIRSATSRPARPRTAPARW